MQYMLFAISALTASVAAQNQQASSELISVISVLQTALPTTLIQEYLTNSAAVESEIVSDFSAGQPPAWFTALPSDVKNYLIPSTSAAANSTQSHYISALPTTSANSTRNSTLSRTSRTPSATLTHRASSSSSIGAQSTGSSGSSTSSGGASMPTVIVGMGIAGAVGLVGVLAL